MRNGIAVISYIDHFSGECDARNIKPDYRISRNLNQHVSNIRFPHQSLSFEIDEPIWGSEPALKLESRDGVEIFSEFQFFFVFCKLQQHQKCINHTIKREIKFKTEKARYLRTSRCWGQTCKMKSNPKFSKFMKN